MLRRLIILSVPAILLVAWLVSAQLPRWTAPQPGWFAAETPGVCAAVASLTLYDASRGSAGGIGAEAAAERAAEIVAEHYDLPAAHFGAALGVTAALPDDAGVKRPYYVVTAQLEDDGLPKAAVIYVDAVDGTPRTLITTVEDAAGCDFDVRAALIAIVRSPPLVLLCAYIIVVAAALIVRRIVSARGVL